MDQTFPPIIEYTVSVFFPPAVYFPFRQLTHVKNIWIFLLPPSFPRKTLPFIRCFVVLVIAVFSHLFETRAPVCAALNAALICAFIRGLFPRPLVFLPDKVSRSRPALL